jgi:ABC-2 type transport system permease protein
MTELGLRAGFPQVLRSEWIKQFSLRSTWRILAATVGVNVVVCLVMFASIGLSADMAAQDPASVGLPPDAEIGPDFFGNLAELVSSGCGALGQLVFVILSVLTITNEYSSGMIQSTFWANPRRWTVLVAKMLVIAGLCVVVFAVSEAAGLLLGQTMLSDTVGVDLDWTSATSIRILLGLILQMVLVSLMAFAIGVLTMSVAGSIGIAVGILLVLPMTLAVITQGLSAQQPTGWRKVLAHLTEFLPSEAGGVILRRQPREGAILDIGTGMAVMGAWVAVPLIAAFIVTKRRDF